MQEYLKQIRQELRLRNYSPKTIKAYLGCLGEYFDFTIKGGEIWVKEIVHPLKIKRHYFLNLIYFVM